MWCRVYASHRWLGSDQNHLADAIFLGSHVIIIHLDVIVAVVPIWCIYTLIMCAWQDFDDENWHRPLSGDGSGSEDSDGGGGSIRPGEAVKGEYDFPIGREQSLNQTQTSNSVWPKTHFILCACVCVSARVRPHLFAFDAAAYYLLGDECVRQTVNKIISIMECHGMWEWVMPSCARVCVCVCSFVFFFNFCFNWIDPKGECVARPVYTHSVDVKHFHSLPPICSEKSQMFLSDSILCHSRSAYIYTITHHLDVVKYVRFSTIFIYLLHSYGLLKTHRSLKTLQIFEYYHIGLAHT